MDGDTDQHRHHGPDSPVTALPFAATAASLNITNQDGILLGYSIVEATGLASAAVDLVDGSDDSAPTLSTVTLTAGQSTREVFSSWGLWIQRGLRLKVISGSVRGVAYVILP